MPPQVEDGYTRIANELLEALCKARLSGAEWIVLLAIIRHTYGWQKKEAPISLTSLADTTAIPKHNLPRTVRSLLSKNLIRRERGAGRVFVYSINKKYPTWVIESDNLKVISPDNYRVIESDNPILHYRKKYLKKLKQKACVIKPDNSGTGKPEGPPPPPILPPYKELIDDLNAVVGSNFQHKTEATRKAINGRWADGFSLEDFKKVHRKKFADWKGKADMVQHLNPGTLYRPSNFERYLNTVTPEEVKNREEQADKCKRAEDDMTKALEQVKDLEEVLDFIQDKSSEGAKARAAELETARRRVTTVERWINKHCNGGAP